MVHVAVEQVASTVAEPAEAKDILLGLKLAMELKVSCDGYPTELRPPHGTQRMSSINVRVLSRPTHMLH